MTTLDFTDAPVWLQWLIIAGVLIATLVAIVRGFPPIWRFVSRTVATVNASGELPEFMRTTTATLKANTEIILRLRSQVENSHQTNLRDELTKTMDATHRTEEQVATVLKQVTAMQENFATLTRSDARQWEALGKAKQSKE